MDVFFPSWEKFIWLNKSAKKILSTSHYNDISCSSTSCPPGQAALWTSCAQLRCGRFSDWAESPRSRVLHPDRLYAAAGAFLVMSFLDTFFTALPQKPHLQILTQQQLIPAATNRCSLFGVYKNIYKASHEVKPFQIKTHLTSCLDQTEWYQYKSTKLERHVNSSNMRQGSAATAQESVEPWADMCNHGDLQPSGRASRRCSEGLPANGRQDGVDKVEECGHVGEHLVTHTHGQNFGCGPNLHCWLLLLTHHRWDVQLIVLEAWAILHFDRDFGQNHRGTEVEEGSKAMVYKVLGGQETKSDITVTH